MTLTLGVGVGRVSDGLSRWRVSFHNLATTLVNIAGQFASRLVNLTGMTGMIILDWTDMNIL